MLVALSILKAVIIIVGMIILIKKVFMSTIDNRLWVAFKIIAVIFLSLLIITVIEFAIM